MTTWVLLRGLTREAGHWGEFTQRLAAGLNAGDTLAALDLPGNGALHAAISPANVAAMAAACREALIGGGLKPPFLLVGMSLGGMVAIQWAHEFENEVAGCVLINTSVRGHSPFWQRLRPRNYARLCWLLWPGLSLLERERQVLVMTSGNPRRHAGLPEQWAAIARQRPVRRANTLRQLIAAAGFTLPVDRPRVPMLLLASARDGLVSPACSRRLASHWSLPLRLHPDAGHDLPLDDADWVVRQIAGWWR